MITACSLLVHADQNDVDAGIDMFNTFACALKLSMHGTVAMPSAATA